MTNPKERVTTIDLLRHGACEGGEIFRGSTDVALSDKGWQQLRAATEPVKGWTRIVASPLQRCARFAEELAQTRALPLQLHDDLREIHFGEWEGRAISDVMRDHGELLSQFWADPTHVTPPGGESMHQFGSRVRGVIEQLLQQHAGEHLLIVSHGAVIRLVMTHWLQMPMSAFSSIAVPYAALSRFRIHERDGERPWIQLCLHRGEV
jgi:alpha-ribazole phosphatase